MAVIGGGPAGLMAAETLASAGVGVTVYERMPSLGRKFLMAGRGGLNLTHSEDAEQFMPRYRDAAPHLSKAITDFSANDLRAWCEGLGQETFVGSSGRVFPKAMKSSPLLRAWLARLLQSGVRFNLRHRWTGWNGGALVFETPAGRVEIKADAAVLALGGGSWAKLGSDGAWTEILQSDGVRVSPLRPSNCGFVANWSAHFRERFEGQPLKPVDLTFDNRSERGELTITRSGLESGAIYAFSASLREAIAAKGEAILHIDMRPDIPRRQLESQLQLPRGKESLSNFLRKRAHLSPVAIGLLNEVVIAQGGTLASMNPAALASLIQSVPVKLISTAPITRAISTAGGIAFDQIDGNFMLRAKSGVFVAGEMLDWEAPTGGYLLQACFATGAAAGRGTIEWLKVR